MEFTPAMPSGNFTIEVLLSFGVRSFCTICCVAMAQARDFAAGVPGATAGSTLVTAIEIE